MPRAESLRVLCAAIVAALLLLPGCGGASTAEQERVVADEGASTEASLADAAATPNAASADVPAGSDSSADSADSADSAATLSGDEETAAAAAEDAESTGVTGASSDGDAPEDGAVEENASKVDAPGESTAEENAPGDLLVGDAARTEGVAMRGINLAGAEFGERLPGEYDRDWTFPTYEEVDFFTDAGMNVIRLPFRWERLQTSLGTSFDERHLALLDEFVRYTAERGAIALLDPHNYAHYYDETIGSDDVPIDAFSDFWGRLAERYGDQDHVVFGLMNEPIGIDSQVWIDAANAAIVAIRATGADNLILVPGNYWTGAHSWLSDRRGMSNAEALLQIVDPADNYAVEVHQYLDSDHSGTSDRCVSEQAGAERLEDFTNWLYEHDLRGFLGEFGAGDNNTCLVALAGMLDHMASHSDVWIGWTYWAAGPWWGDYIFEVEPTNGVSDDPQFQVLIDYLDN